MAEPLIWLPLNGDLRNNGLDGTTFTNNASSGYTIASIDNGKTGKCYSFDGHNWLSSSSTVGENMTNWTIACWICPTELDSTWRRIGGIGKHIRTHLDISSANYPRFFCSKDGTTNNYVACNATGNILQTNTWYHLCGVVSDKYVRLYINGEQISSTSRPDDLANFSADTVYIGSIESGNRFIGKICDFRIYDTALSDYEVRLLSQGLVLHYPLDRNGLGGENLITNSLPNGSGTLWSVAGTDWARAFVASDFSPSGYVCRATYNGSTTTTTGGAYRTPCIAKTDFEDGETYTLSGWLRADTTCAIRFCNEMMTTATNITVTPEWQYFTYTSTIDSSKTYWANVMYRMGSIYNGCWQEACMIKLEKGSKATPWCPADSELSDLTTVYDTSGFGNNGTTTNVTYDGDTARYTASSVFDGDASVIIIPNIYTTSVKNPQMSFAFWMKRDNYTDGINHYIYNDICQIYTYSTYKLRITWKHMTDDSSANNTWECGLTVPADEWHHIVYTFDGGVMKIYYDGKYYNISDRSSTGQYMGSFNYTAIASAYNGTTKLFYGGSLSDFRIYSTCLDEAEIKDLFDASAKINRDGTMYAYSYVEV